MFKRFAAIVATVVVALALSGGPATAQQYPPQQASITATAQATVPGGTVTFTASGFLPGSEVTFTLFSTPVVLGKVNANANGVATLTVKIPESTPYGNHTVTASGIDPTGKPLTVSLPLVVAPQVVNGQPIFPRTGASSTTTDVARGGAALLAAGALMVLVTRQRRARTAPSAA